MLQEAVVLRFVASNVTAGIVPDSGHWITDENPDCHEPSCDRLPGEMMQAR
jgi:hypothetical protein